MSKIVSGTKEWAATGFNVMNGCENLCRYCYARANAARFKVKDVSTWGDEEVKEGALEKSFGKRRGTIMFPTAHDLTLSNLQYTLPVLKKMLEAGNDVLVVSKPHAKVISQVMKECEGFREQILFRFTIGAADDRTLSLWEPGAPMFFNRLTALSLAHREGFKTSVSMEPLLEPDESKVVSMVDLFESFVTDAIWIGKMNKLEERLKRNGEWDGAVQTIAAELLVSQSDERICSLYERLKNRPIVKWKESIKKVVGLEIPTEAGLDI